MTTQSTGPTGLRRLTPAMAEAWRLSEQFRGTTVPRGEILAAFKAAAPVLGIRPQLVHAIDALFASTQQIDWLPGQRPLVWHSAQRQQTQLQVSPAQVKRINRQLAEAGLVVMRDSPTGVRRGERANGKTGPILWAYGFDLSPLAVRYEEFCHIKDELIAQQKRFKDLRTRLTIARKTMRQHLETAGEMGLAGEAWISWATLASKPAPKPALFQGEAELIEVVLELERAVVQARAAVNIALDAKGEVEACSSFKETVNKYPAGLTSEPPYNTTTKPSSIKSNTVEAQEKGSRGQVRGFNQPTQSEDSGERPNSPYLGRKNPDRFEFAKNRGEDLAQPELRLTPRELVKLCPRLENYLWPTKNEPTWDEVVESASRLADHMGISRHLWGQACLTLNGRERAAIAVAIVSTKPPEHFQKTPGHYFHAMIQRASLGELHLDKSIWGLRKYGATC